MGWDGMVWSALVLVQGQVVGSCECGNEQPGSIKCGEFLGWLKNC